MVNVIKKSMPFQYEAVETYNIIYENETLENRSEELEWIEKAILIVFKREQELCLVIEHSNFPIPRNRFTKSLFKKKRVVIVDLLCEELVSLLLELRNSESDFLLMRYEGQDLNEILQVIRKKTKVRPIVYNQWKNISKNVLAFFSHFDYFIFYENRI